MHFHWMRAELRCVPYVEVIGILCAALISSLLTVYEYNWVCTIGIAVFGIVILLKPIVSLSPVTVKDIIVEFADWFVDIVTLDIWKLVTFPLIAR